MSINWIVSTMCWYGLSLNSVNLPGNIYVSFVLSALIEIPSYIFVMLTMDGLGRKTILAFCQILGGICCILAGVIKVDWAVTVLSLAGS